MGAKGVRIALWCEETDYASFKCMNGGDALPSVTNNGPLLLVRS